MMALGALLAAAARPALASDREHLKSLYGRLDAAFVARDVEAYMACFDPEVVTIDREGHRHDARAMRAQYQRFLSRAREVRHATRVDEVKNAGERVTAVVRSAVFAEVPTKEGWKAGAGVDTYEDAWAIGRGEWRLTTRRLLASQVGPVPPDVAQRIEHGGQPAPAPAEPEPQQQERPQEQAQQARRATQPAAPAKRGSSQTFYDKCIQNCQHMSTSCTMAHGLGGRSSLTGMPCLSSQVACEQNCKAAH
jgi:hypothetical protein